MIPALVSLKGLIKTKSYHIDYPLFRLHYQVTVCLLLGFCLVLTAKILFGDTIDCQGRLAGRSDYLDNMCFARGTYTQYAIDEAACQCSVCRHLTGHRLANNRTLPRAAQPPDEPTGPSQSVAPPTTTERPNVITILADFAENFLFDQTTTPAPRLPSPESLSVDLSGAGNRSLAASTISFADPNALLPNELLANSLMGRLLKDNFRLIHRSLRSCELKFKSSLAYLYSGVLIPREKQEVYSVAYWHRYYQYIPIILFLQAVFFYIPHYLWKTWENGVVSSICKQLHDNRFSPTDYFESNYHMIDYLQNCFTLNKSLVYKYYVCNVLSLINVVAQIIILDVIFNNQFITYGIDVIHYLFIDSDIYGLRDSHGRPSDLNSPMDFVFPKVTTCTYTTLSSAGSTPNVLTLMCILPLNILHDKFFLILWFWFLFLATLTILQIILDTIYSILPMLRKYLFIRRFGPYLWEADNRRSSSLSELFLLDLIGSNSDKFAFAAMLRKLNKEDWQASPSENQSLV